MKTTSDYRDSWVNPGLKIAALWAFMMFVFAYVDLFILYRADLRADLEAGQMFAFTIDQGFLFGVTLYIALPALMVLLNLTLPVTVTRIADIILAIVYGLTIVGSAVGEWSYDILGSAIEVALLAGIAYYAWTCPKTTESATAVLRDSRASHLAR